MPTETKIRVKTLFLSVLLLMTSLSLPVWAERVADLYSVTVPVADQGKRALKTGVRDAFAQVLLKVTGSRDVMSRPEVIAAQSRASSYVLQYSYSTVSVKGQKSEKKQTEKRLKVDFQHKAIQALLRQAQLPMWTANRPNVLIWLVVDDTRHRQLMGAEALPDMQLASRQRAQLRGLPLSIPLLDLEDSMALTLDDVWGFNSSLIHGASQRYNSDAVLVGRVVITSTSRWMGSWWFDYQGKTVTFDGQGDDAQSYLGFGVDTIADQLAEKYAIYPSVQQEGRIQLVLDGVSDFSAYASASKYLKTLVSVRELQLLALNGDQLVFELAIEGEIEQLQSLLKIDRRLQPGLAVDDAESDQQRLYYRWPSSAQ